MEASVWLKGRFGFAGTESEAEERAVMRLAGKGLAEMEDETDSISKYRILTRCVYYPTRQSGHLSSRLNERDGIYIIGSYYAVEIQGG